MTVNPKAVAASSKPRLDLLEPVADAEIARAMASGTERYGIRNYRRSPVSARVYYAAMRRHLGAWLDGEDVAPDSGVHHLAHVAANVHVVLAAIQAGTFADDREAS